MLTVSDLSRRYGEYPILERVSFVVNPRDRIGLVGPNGAGKSTLLAILAGELEADAGAVTMTPGARLGHLPQGFADLPGGTLAGLLDVPTGGLLAARDAVERSTAALAEGGEDDLDAALAAYDAALAAFEALGGFAAVDELRAFLAALGLEDVPFETPLGALSGGQKTRAGLAALLASRPDILLLDEPTNHLDLDALAWLRDFIKGYRGAVLIVSHDRAFLDETVTTIFELSDTTHQLTVYPGNYSDYLAAKRAAEESQAEAYARQQAQISRVEQDIRNVAGHAMQTEKATQNDFLRRRAKKVARTAKVRERKLERLLESEELVDKPALRWGLSLDFGAPPESGRDVALVEGAAVELGGRTILHDIDLHVGYGERIALTGPNGSGKSTLLKLLLGELAPSAGRVRLGAGVVPGRYAQEQETVALERSVLEQVRARAPLSETEARTFLHLFLFGQETVFKRGAELSYGERARLALALLVLGGANFLLLDEPLNHLDLQSREEFEQALTRFGGTLLIVLHDRYAIERLATRVLELRDGRLAAR